jgi:NADP-dependent 3-hydroxy acid dehydrogenase YdfG
MCTGKSIGVKGIVDQDEDEWDFILDVNLKGVMWCLKHQLKSISSGGSIGMQL